MYVSAKYLALLLLCACSQPVGKEITKPDNDELLSNLYYQADTVIRRNDTVFIVNSKYDTTLVDTGIFTCLPYDYPLTSPSKLVRFSKSAQQAEKAGLTAEARVYYLAIIKYYQDEWLTKKPGFENGGFSDLNDYFAANVNVMILVSHAFEKLGHLPEALHALAPFLANAEAEHSRIQRRYIQLCIRHYGKAATRQALNVSGQTVYRLPDQSPESDRWRVKVFGADLGIDDYDTDTLLPQEAQAIVGQQPFYQLVK